MPPPTLWAPWRANAHFSDAFAAVAKGGRAGFRKAPEAALRRFCRWAERAERS